jgi:hypothetical protein
MWSTFLRNMVLPQRSVLQTQTSAQRFLGDTNGSKSSYGPVRASLSYLDAL